MTREHLAKMQAGKRAAEKAARENGMLQAALFCEWSKAYSQGKASLYDIPCGPCDGVTDADFDNARAEGLI